MFTEKQLVQFGNYVISQERKKRFSSLTRQSKKEGTFIQGTRERLSSITHADIENFKQEIAENPEIQYTQSREVILR